MTPHRLYVMLSVNAPQSGRPDSVAFRVLTSSAPANVLKSALEVDSKDMVMKLRPKTMSTIHERTNKIRTMMVMMMCNAKKKVICPKTLENWI